MLYPKAILIGWILHLVTCFYLVRFISNITIRCILTLVPCTILTYMVAYDVRALDMSCILPISFCWLVSIRLVHLTILSPNECSTFKSFVLKFLWIFFPIVPCTSYQHEKWPIFYDFITITIKIIVNHWMYQWLLTCEGSDSYTRLIMFYIFTITYTFVSDIQSAIVRIITRDKYMLKPTINFPFFSRSVREFWGQRHNQLVNTVFRESIFQPIRQYQLSATISSLIVFFISGIIHVHLALATFKDSRSTIPTMIFFLLHGLACIIEVRTPFRLPTPISWFLTQLFLLATVSLQLGPFTRIGPDLYATNIPPLFEQKWIPKLPAPNFCPQ